MGDFNDSILQSSTIYKFMTDKGFYQRLSLPTSEKGTLIDHVYLSISILFQWPCRDSFS